MNEERPGREGLPVIRRSDAMHRRAEGLIPAATQTLAKGAGEHVGGVAPKMASFGQGPRMWDADGNGYLDLTMAVGPLVLGYTHPEVDDAIRQQLASGITFSLVHPLEVEVAEMLRDLIPGAEMVRFSKTGADATSAAVRLARAYTGRERVLCCGYHGWHDWYIGVTDRARGVPRAVADLVATFEYNDIQSLIEAIDTDTACVVLEPVAFEHPKDGFLRKVRNVCDDVGAVLVFDEMWTGFRLALGGAQQAFGVRADLACFSKAIANGMPLSALVGKRDIMRLLEREVFFFTTFGGEALSLAAARATLNVLSSRSVPDHLAAMGRRLRTGIESGLADNGIDWVRVVGMDCRTQVVFDPSRGDPLLQKSIVQQELLRRRVLWSGAHNLSLAHGSAEIDEAVDAYRHALRVLAAAVRTNDLSGHLLGLPIEPVFRRTSQFNTKPRDGHGVAARV